MTLHPLVDVERHAVTLRGQRIGAVGRDGFGWWCSVRDVRTGAPRRFDDRGAAEAAVVAAWRDAKARERRIARGLDP